MNNEPTVQEPKSSKGKILLIVSGVLLLCFLMVGWIIYRQVFPKQLKPVRLSQSESSILNKKVKEAGFPELEVDNKAPHTTSSSAPTPTPYSEKSENRVLRFSQKELNALIAANSDLANKVAVHLSSNTISLNTVIPVAPDFPVIGGKNLKASAGVEVGMENDQPKIIIKGVSVWGVPVPNAWMGGLKGKDIAQEIKISGSNQSETSLGKGIKYIKIENGELVIELNE